MNAQPLSLPEFDWDFFLVAAEFLAAQTKIKSDDEFVEFLKVAKQEAEAAGWLKTKAAEDDSGVLRIVAAPEGAILGEDPPLSLIEAVERRGIFKGAKDRAETIAKLREAAKWVLELYRLYKTFAK